jgi:hypothetical protein
VFPLAALAPSTTPEVYNRIAKLGANRSEARIAGGQAREKTMNSAPSPWTIRHLLAMTAFVAVAMALFQMSFAGNTWASFAFQVMLAGVVPMIALAAVGFLATLFAGLGITQAREDARKSPFAEERLPDPVVRSSRPDVVD